MQEETNSILHQRRQRLQQQVNVHIKVTAETYVTDYEMPCTLRVRGRRICGKLRLTVFCVCVCVCVCSCV